MMAGKRRSKDSIELQADIDRLIQIIDDARHAIWRTGQKVEPTRRALSTVPADIRADYEDRRLARRAAAGGDLPMASRIARSHPLAEEV